MSPSSLAERFAQLPASKQSLIFDALSDGECADLLKFWPFWARDNQLEPLQDDWFCWLVMAGRGFGKTRMGAEWVRSRVEGETPLSAPKGAPERVALVAETSADAREVMLEGESGLMGICKEEYRPTYEATRRRLIWPNGIIGYLYSATEPDQLRGPQHALAWADEIAKWRAAEDVWSNLVLGLRLGKRPQVMVTTTPRPIPLLKTMLGDRDVIVTRGSTFENKSNLSARFIEQVKHLYAGTRLGRQELDGDLLEDVPGALWTRQLLEQCRIKQKKEYVRIVVAVDPPVTSGVKADGCGIVAVGLDLEGKAVVLADNSSQGLRPMEWAKQAIQLYHRLNADRIIAEVNNGGELVETIIRQIDPDISFQAVRASRGKITRAEPVAALYEQGRVLHCGCFNALEDEMCSYTGDRRDESPDRLDALVWGITELMLRTLSTPTLRKL